MSIDTIGQRCASTTEPELGLGLVVSVDRFQIGIDFPSSGEKRLYAPGTSILKRVQFPVGETIQTRDGVSLVVESVEEQDGLYTYIAGSTQVREDTISGQSNANSPLERLIQGDADPGSTFDLRHRALRARSTFRQSTVRGFLGGRIDLIPHQFYILQEVARRQIPRVLLADEVGLGKTIEACLILQRLLAIGKVKRVLILVPETLVHQWFVELLRRFNLWFSIFDEERCEALEKSNPDSNPFLDEQLALCSLAFPSHNEIRREQILEGDWDMIVVDEAHHLEWTPENSNPEYDLVESLAACSFGLLLLTATPTQLGMTGHFARLRLLDPDRYGDFESFLAETRDYGTVATIVDRILEGEELDAADRVSLRRIFRGDTERLDRLFEGMKDGDADARQTLIQALLDEHGTGRVVFRNTRAAMTGFPKRSYRPVPIECPSISLLKRMNREVNAEATGTESEIRYNFRDDPRVDWLLGFLREHTGKKVLLISRSKRKTMALEAALKEKTNLKIALFHEDLALVSRDRNAAWFAEPEGANLLICSEIGSEGRNFQFAHHLVLFDLPLNPGLLEQRIGRLDRIGQSETIRIHFPYVEGSAAETVQDWFHRGLDAMETLIHSGNEYEHAFRARLLKLALDEDIRKTVAGKKKIEKLIADTVDFRKELSRKMHDGRDRLLELNSFNPKVAGEIVERIQEADRDPLLRELLFELLDHFGVSIAEHDDGDVFLDASHAFVEAFPSLPREGTLATFDRLRAIQREDITFITPDHPLLRDTLDLMLNSPRGTVAFCRSIADTPNIIIEAIYLHESVTRNRSQVESFLAPAPIRVVVDVRGNILTDKFEPPEPVEETEGLRRLLDSGGLSIDLIKTLLEATEEQAEAKAQDRQKQAGQRVMDTLGQEIQRLVDLRKINDHVRPEEIELAQKQLDATIKAIARARLRLDSLRLVIEGPG